MEITAEEIAFPDSGKSSRRASLERSLDLESVKKKKASVSRSFSGIWKQLVEKEKAKREGGKNDSIAIKSKEPLKDRPQKRSGSIGPKSLNALVRLPDGENMMTQKPSRAGKRLTKSQTIVETSIANLNKFMSTDNQENIIRVSRHVEHYESVKEEISSTRDDEYEENEETDSGGAEEEDFVPGDYKGEEDVKKNEEEDDCRFPDQEEREAEDAVEPLQWHKTHNRRRSKSTLDVSSIAGCDSNAEKRQSSHEMTESISTAISRGTPGIKSENLSSIVWCEPPRFQGLWCEQARVINSGILDGMDQNERKLQEMLFEVISTEENYLRSLDLVLNYFKVSLEAADERSVFGLTQNSNFEVSIDRESAILQKYESEILFFNIGTIRDYSEKFITLFELNQGDRAVMDNYLDPFTEYVDSVLRRAIIKYCSNMSHQTEILKTLLNKNKEFTRRITELEADSRLNDKTFQSFLMVPMTRICQLPLLIERVMKVSEKLTDEFSVSVYNSAKKAYAAVKDVASQCNQETRKLEEMAEKQMVLLNIERTLLVPLNMKFSLISASRTLLCECNVKLVTQSSKLFKNNIEIKLHFKLFHDILLICKPVQDKFAVLDIADVRCGSVYLYDLCQINDNQNLDRCKFLSHSQKQKLPISMVMFRTKVGDYLDSGALQVPRISDGPIDPQSMGPVCFQDYEQIYIIQPTDKRELFIRNMRSCIANRRSSANQTMLESVSQIAMGSKKTTRSRKLSSIDDRSLSMSQLDENHATIEEQTFTNIAKNSAFLPLSPRQGRKTYKYSNN